MSVNSVSSVSVSTVKPQKNETIEKVKNAVDFNKDGDVKLEGSIIGLGIAGLVAIGLALKGRHQKAAQVVTEQGEKVAQTVVEQGTKVVQTVEAQAQKAETQLKSAVDAYKKGASYGKAKNTATRNLPKDLKAQNKASMQAELLQRRNAELATRELSQNVTNTVNTAVTNQKIASNNITSKTLDGVNAQIGINKKAAEEARNAADAAKEIAKENPTKKYQRKAVYAEHKAAITEANNVKKQAKLDKSAADIVESEEKKLQNALKHMEETTPQKRQEADIKMRNNADNASLNAIKRADKELLKKPGTQKALQDIKRQRWSNDKILDAALNESGKYSKYEQRAAQAIVNGEIKL